MVCVVSLKLSSRFIIIKTIWVSLHKPHTNLGDNWSLRRKHALQYTFTLRTIQAMQQDFQYSRENGMGMIWWNWSLKWEQTTVILIVKNNH
jgi:hypothetical protein